MDSLKKIVGVPVLKKKIAALKKKRKKIAFTNGCFDILHYGHVNYLEKAKKDNRVLVVGINSDSSIKRIKGDLRPILGQKERTSLLAALACVDFVTIFNEDTPQKLIEAVKPDVLIKGADWKGKPIAGADFIQAYGGKVEFIKFIDGFSTTNIIQKILEKCRT